MTEQNPKSDTDSFVSHLQELRKRLIWSVVFIVIAFLVSWNFSTEIFDIIRQPIAPYLNKNTGGLVFTGVMDKFTAHLKVSMLAAIIFSCPFWIYQIWMFISPGLYKNEKKYIAAICAAPGVLARLGMLKNKKATTLILNVKKSLLLYLSEKVFIMIKNTPTLFESIARSINQSFNVIFLFLRYVT